MSVTSSEIVRFENVTKRYPGDSNSSLSECSFQICCGEIIIFLGESGSGKTTALKLINRLIEPSEGRIFLESQDVSSLEPTSLRRSIGYVIQGVGLFPHMTVARNVGVVPELLKWTTEKIRARVHELLEMVNLPPDAYARRYPFQLSGGERQRVGLARALAAQPKLLLLDEPFGAIDSVNRATLQKTLLALQRTLGFTAIMVTHDVNEAFLLADRIAVMRKGKILQFAEPFSIAAAPQHEYVSELVGGDGALRRLSLIGVRHAMSLSVADELRLSVRVEARESLSRALERMLEEGETAADVWDENVLVGRISLEDIRRFSSDFEIRKSR